MIQVFRVKHIPTGMYYTTGSSGSRVTNNLSEIGKAYIGEETLKIPVLCGKQPYFWITLKESFSLYNYFLSNYKYKEFHKKKHNYIKCRIPKEEFEKEIIATL